MPECMVSSQGGVRQLIRTSVAWLAVEIGMVNRSAMREKREGENQVQIGLFCFLFSFTQAAQPQTAPGHGVTDLDVPIPERDAARVLPPEASYAVAGQRGRLY